MKTYELLFIGNSHSSSNNLPKLVTKLIKTGLPGSNANASLAPGMAFLDNRLTDKKTNKVLIGGKWTHVILQAQKYSTTGLYSYPTDAAEEWIRRIKKQNSTPIMFPEWPRHRNKEEGQRIHDLHKQIATKEPAYVAPIGLTWDAVQKNYPSLNLYKPDGNHANLTGSLLTAFVFYEVITGENVINLPYVPTINVSATIQQQLRKTVSAVIKKHPARPDDL